MRVDVTAAIFVLAFALLSGCDGRQDLTAEEMLDQDEIRRAYTEFFFAAYAPGGDTNAAYELLSQASRESCQREDFEQITQLGRQALSSREPTLRFETFEIREDRATIKVLVRIGSFTDALFPPDVTMVKEDADWRFLITTDPTCVTISAFYDIRDRPGIVPGRQVTPEALGNPDCDQAYPVYCIPSPPPILSCSDVEAEAFPALPPDPHGFDTDGDGFGCEDDQPSDPASEYDAMTQ